jgi:hypothetical protein
MIETDPSMPSRLLSPERDDVMMRKIQGLTVGVAILLAFGASRAEAQDMTQWLQTVEKKVRQAVPDAAIDASAVKAGVRSNRNQIEAPAMSGNSTSLIDTSSATDLLSVALNLAGLTEGTKSSAEAESTTGTFTASAYALYSGARGQDPLNPRAYCDDNAHLWRSFWVTLGFDNEDSSADSENPIVVGAKLRLPLPRFRPDVCDWKHADRFQGLRNRMKEALEEAADAYSEVFEEIEPILHARFDSLPADVKGDTQSKCPDLDPDDFWDEAIGSAECFPHVLEVLNPDAEELAEELFQARSEPFHRFDAEIRRNIEELQGKSDASLAFTTKQRSNGDDEYSTSLVFEHGILPRTDLTLNASHEYKDEMDGGGNHGGRVAGAVELQPFPDVRLAGPKPMRISLGVEGKWMQSEDPLYKGQLKVNLPIPFVDFLSGFEIPLSLTIANRTDLIDETDVRGMIGFTLDTAQVLAEVRNRFLGGSSTP